MSPRLAGKVAIVTGAGSSGPGVGTGQAIARLFASEGARVILVNRVAEHSREVLELIKIEGGQGLAIAGDVTLARDCERIVETAIQSYGALDVLVNNVATTSHGSVLQVPEDEWDRVLAVNLKSMMLMSKYAIPRMAQLGGGAVVNISSMGAWYARRTASVAYAASKGGVVSLTKSMAMAHGSDGIRVNCVMPGPIYTPIVASGMSKNAREQRRLSSPLGLEGTAWDVAWATLFLASAEARWITAVSLPVDGGIFTSQADPIDSIPRAK
jgi:NAD(P)-dependent dehydrogenase (short-subunit alcohol dehydrogenase family)